MSWHTKIVGSDREKLKNKLFEELTKYPSTSNEKIAEGINILMNAFPINENIALEVYTTGHIDSNGFGNVKLEIGALFKDSILS
jgi:CRISPR/Cas system CSM-associated protein Csm3 (group 7 of RAMP superfamily)